MPVLEVSQVIRLVRDVLERETNFQDIWVEGEIANLARPGSGHCYFTLRDSAASVRCVMFRYSHGAELLGNGALIIAHGRVAIYEPRGDLQFIVDLVQPQGVGELQLKLEQLKLKLEKEGLFEPARKRTLPDFPRKIGVITSPSGAVWHDIKNVMARRYPLVELVLAPTAVQGEEAINGIVEAFKALDQLPDIDVVILARGGGSLEDLWAFNEEAVARAIFKSRAPVISGVGHETDFTIADFVADCRAPTPSAAAELAVPDRVELAARIVGCRQALSSNLSAVLAERRDRLSSLTPRLRRCKPDLDALRMRLDDLLRHATRHLKSYILVKRGQYDGFKSRLVALSPSETLRRGYAIIQTGASSDVVSGVEQVTTGDTVRVTLARGGFDAEVLNTRKENTATG